MMPARKAATTPACREGARRGRAGERSQAQGGAAAGRAGSLPRQRREPSATASMPRSSRSMRAQPRAGRPRISRRRAKRATRPRRYAVGDYLAAMQDWHEGAATLAALDKAVPQALADAVKQGADALAAAKTGAARQAYQLALAIEPKHPPAIAGLARADRLDAALAAAAARGVMRRRTRRLGRGGLPQGAFDRFFRAGRAGGPQSPGREPSRRRLFRRDVARLCRRGRGPERTRRARLQPGACAPARRARGERRAGVARPGQRARR